MRKNHNTGWRDLCTAVRSHYPNAIDIPPKETELLDSQFPAGLKSLYLETNGLNISGYLPDTFGKNQMTFSIIPLEDVISEYKNLMRGTPEKSAIWFKLPQSIRIMTAGDEADFLWHPEWIPFAEDGGGNYQFIKKTTGAVFQYDCSFEIQKLNASLENYFADVASRIEAGTLKPFNID